MIITQMLGSAVVVSTGRRRHQSRMKSATLLAAMAGLSVVLAACRSEPLVPAVQTQHGEVTQAKAPDCSGVEKWPTAMAFAHLKNAGITNNERLDFKRTKTTRLASEQIKDGLFRQIHYVTFTDKSGNKIEVITVNDASADECSMSGVNVYVISKHLGPD
jgi:hypothetical protein